MANETLHYNDAGTHVLVYNPETDARWECPPDYLPVAKARGWQPAEPEPDEYADVFAESTAEGEGQTGFDPAEHSVDEVSAHLAKHAESSPGEVERVLDLERAGKNRKTIAVPDGFESLG